MVAFPVRVAPEVAPVSAAGGEEAIVGAETLAGRSYLLLDDIAENTFIMEQVLKKYHVKTTSYQDGRLALEVYRHAPSSVDGIITDLRMPDMSGQTFIAEIRKLEREAHAGVAVPILVVTGENSGEEKRLCLAQEATDFLLKPVKLRELVLALVKFHSAPLDTKEKAKRILVVDDDATGSRFISAVLIRGGHSCTNVFSIRDGLKELLATRFDVVILDNLLGDGTGADFLRLATAQRRPWLPKVISISGNPVDEQRLMYDDEAMKVEGYLQKPVRKQDLLGMVKIM